MELTDTKAESHDSEKKSVLPAGCHTHDVDPKYAFLTTARRDADGRTPDDPSFNARTLKVDWHKEPINKLTGTQQTWWQVKETHADCVLFYKIGKFYELYHTDADVGVAEAGLVYMKGDQAHAGFPELAYGKYVEASCATLNHTSARCRRRHALRHRRDSAPSTRPWVVSFLILSAFRARSRSIHTVDSPVAASQGLQGLSRRADGDP